MSENIVFMILYNKISNNEVYVFDYMTTGIFIPAKDILRSQRQEDVKRFRPTEPFNIRRELGFFQNK